MSVDVSVEENWVIESELTDQPPRRITESGYPDYNKPNIMFLYAIGGGAALLGLIMMFAGLAGGRVGLAVFGILLALGGVFVAFWLAPQMLRKHIARAEHLIANGVPVMARILTSDNIGGDNSDVRRLRYQISLPNGELTHKDVNADDRVLPKRIPSNVTALMDMESGDVELYCALPYRAVLKTTTAKNVGTSVKAEPLVPATSTSSTSASTPQAPLVGVPGRMGTIQVEAAPETERPRRKTEEEAPAKEEKSNGTAGLPWE